MSENVDSGLSRSEKAPKNNRLKISFLRIFRIFLLLIG